MAHRTDDSDCLKRLVWPHVSSKRQKGCLIVLCFLQGRVVATWYPTIFLCLTSSLSGHSVLIIFASDTPTDDLASTETIHHAYIPFASTSHCTQSGWMSARNLVATAEWRAAAA